MPIDVFNIHPYTFAGQAADIDTFKSFIEDWRRYMRAIGETDKPLIITEFGVLDASVPEEQVQNFMRNCFDYLLTASSKEYGYPPDDYRLVQRWAWFVLNDGEDYYEGRRDNTALFDSDPKTIRPLGITYREYIKNLAH